MAGRLTEISGSAVPLLGKIPLSVPLREGSDAGAPVVINQPEDEASIVISNIAEQILADKIGLAGKKLGLSVN